MAGIYKVIANLGDVDDLKLEFTSKAVAIDVRDQLKKAGYEVKAEMSKELD